MPTVITIPQAQRTKSVKFGAAYSPALTFNPDKNLFYACHGVLTGMALTVNTVPNPDEITVGPGAFIQRGIIVNVTSSQVLQFPDPLPSPPLYLVAENANEVSGSTVQYIFTTAPAADSVIIAQWFDSPIVTTTFEEPQKISICEIKAALESIVELVIKRHHIVASAAQTVLTIPIQNSYVLGANKIWVYRNGKKLEVGIDYAETSPTAVTLTNPALAGDFFELITFRSAPPITSISLLDLTDVTTDLANAIKDTSLLRVSPATAANPLATLEDTKFVVKDEGATVEPLTKTLNFTGSGVSAVAGGGGQVNVSVSGTPPPNTVGITELKKTLIFDADVTYGNTTGSFVLVSLESFGGPAFDKFYLMSLTPTASPHSAVFRGSARIAASNDTSDQATYVLCATDIGPGFGVVELRLKVWRIDI
jgi:hypothetical protein